MKRYFGTIAILVVSLCCASAAFADTNRREQAIQRIESSWFESQFLSERSPMGNILTDSYRQVNPGVSDADWAPVQREILTEMAPLLIGPRGTMDRVLRKVAGEFTDEELEQLAALMNDPTYRKYQSALATPEVQNQIVLELSHSMMRITEIADEVLTRHGLRTLHPASSIHRFP